MEIKKIESTLYSDVVVRGYNDRWIEESEVRELEANYKETLVENEILKDMLYQYQQGELKV